MPTISLNSFNWDLWNIHVAWTNQSQSYCHFFCVHLYIVNTGAHTLVGPDIVLYRWCVHLYCRTCPLQLYAPWCWPGLCFVNQSQNSFDLHASLWLVHYSSSRFMRVIFWFMRVIFWFMRVIFGSWGLYSGSEGLSVFYTACWPRPFHTERDVVKKACFPFRFVYKWIIMFTKCRVQINVEC